MKGAFDLWKSHFEQRLIELSTALTFDRPELFAAGMKWARDSFKARGLPESDLALGLVALEDVLRDELPSGSADALVPYLEAARSALEQATDSEQPLEADDRYSKLALEYVVAVLEGDGRKGIRMLEEAIANGDSAPTVCDKIIAPAQREIGRLWHAGQIGVASEHFATMTAQRALTLLFHRVHAKPLNGHTCLIACPAGNHHDLGLRMLAENFEVEGWRAILLGGDMPASDLSESLDHYEPDLLILSATLSRHLIPLRDTISTIRAAEHQVSSVPILVGGGAVNSVTDLWKQMGADGWAASLQDSVGAAASLIRKN